MASQAGGDDDMGISRVDVEVELPEDSPNLVGRGAPEGVRREAEGLYELFLYHGVDSGVARNKVSELCSPPRVIKEI